MPGRWIDNVRCAVLIVAVLAGATRTAAQTTSIQSDPALLTLNQQIGIGDEITVTLLDGSTVTGRFGQASTEGVSLLASGPREVIPAARIARVQRRRVGVVLGSVIGAGVGLACGLALGSLYANEGADPTKPIVGLTALGLGVGFGIDAALNLPRTVYRAGRAKTSAAIEVGPNRAGVRVAVTF